MDIESAIKERYLNLEWALDERLRRLYAAAEAKAIGHVGVALVWKAAGVAPGSIQKGLKELVERPEAMESNSQRIRRIGAGRKTSITDDAELLSALARLVEPVTSGDPESPLRWTCKTLRQLESELLIQGYIVSHTSIDSLLKKLGYSLQGNRKTLEGINHPDRNAQFEYINARTEEAVRNGRPVISVDTKKKGLFGQFKNGGKEWRPQGDQEQVNVYDFVNKELGRVNP
jgi:transposase